ncbi:threonine--tRNA ligase [Clostridium felsineum]|uniref:Threonine--tRNA ligase n=1 Tax=Clostridium felsineum TaxID=36839 RepID=A0A1S8KXG0_9CLOT|nr:threonine--tRNA ligase [Clostridium felsineum]MCR3759829.1 threonine--tRNA ligase [Clostridium felsineum]URZ00111.1 Threonine--tRNA ligase 2 [Clostridium felsineum]URZ07244.1 Threonine--tRNA ligase 2 [Clostridium felsineum]URZ12273.1 Threonine--tRNA ligase 2 [Clostridium felsineum]URZ16942.1 Threonine--tRNA ligase 2 [Clostridium felsineum DSM 794]
MIKVTLKDGKVMEFNSTTTPGDIAKSISPGLYKKAISAKINGERAELMTNIDKDCTLEILTFDDEDGKWTLRHTASHILAQAIKRLYPEAKLAIGPAIDEGFYYDIDADFSFTEEMFPKIEKEMDKIIKENLKLEKFELPREKAIEYMEEKKEPYKVELIKDLPEDAVISFYKQGDFVDLCAGPHVESTAKVKVVKLMSVAGAYWRGNEKNKMLQRIYGTAFTKKADLEEYIHMLEEAKKRDHRKIGKELDLFTMHEEGPGFPFFHPKGMVIKNILLNYWRQVHNKAGYDEISTPVILNEQLWHQSGHWDHYKENMYFTKIDEQDYAIKPMNCPGSILVYKDNIHSYRELPIKLGEIGLVHRHEKSGALHGLMRVRCFNQDDAHIFMTKDQITEEILKVIKLIDSFYKVFGFDYYVELSTRPEDSMGSDEDWEAATNGLINALNAANLKYIVNEGDGAFYGPKIDFHLKDCIGRTWQCGTIQLDFQMPERFDINYVGADGEKHRPVMVHRVVFGSIERFIGILIEHYAGAFPTWLAPVQVKVMNITDSQVEYVDVISQKLRDAGIRVEKDVRNEKIGYKIREAQLKKIPYMIVIGDKEIKEGVISVRSRKEGDLGSMNVEDFIFRINAEVKQKINSL